MKSCLATADTNAKPITHFLFLPPRRQTVHVFRPFCQVAYMHFATEGAISKIQQCLLWRCFVSMCAFVFLYLLKRVLNQSAASEHLHKVPERLFFAALSIRLCFFSFPFRFSRTILSTCACYVSCIISLWGHVMSSSLTVRAALGVQVVFLSLKTASVYMARGMWKC